MATTSTNTDHPPPPPITLDSSDPLNLIIHTTPMDDNNDPNASPPDWSQLSSLWPEHDSAVPHSNSKPHFNEYLDFNMASGLLDMDFDMSSLNGTVQLGPGGIEPSALHLDRFGYPSYDDSFSFPASASPADILAAQFPFTFQPDALMDTSGVLQTPNTNQRRLSITSSSSSSGQSFSPAPESIPSPGYGYTSDSSTQQSFSTPELTSDHSFGPADSAPVPVTATTAAVPQENGNSKVAPDFSANPAAELAYRVCQSAGVMRAVPMNGNSTFQPGQQAFPSPNSLQAKLPIPRLQQQQQQQQRQAGNSLPKSSTPSATSSAASTPPPSTPPSNNLNESTPALPTQGTTPTIAAVAAAAIADTTNPHIHANNANANANNRPKTSHTTIERRYRTNLNARIQSLRMAVPALRVLEDRDSGSSKKIKKNLKGGVLIQKSSSSLNSSGGGTTTTTVIAVPGDPSPSNPYGEVDVIDERGYVDGVKVARKCSKANVLGKAVEYIRVLKRREGRLKAEQEGLKTLLCGLVGGPALLREWEREWRERFGGEERDEVDPEERDVDDDEEGEEDDIGVDEQEDEDGGGETGKKRKRAKVEVKDNFGSGVPVVMVKKEPKPPSVVVIGADGQPEKRKRGRPRKVPLPQQHSNSGSPVMQGNNNVVVGAQTTEQPQQYLLAVFALFSFFNYPLTSSSSSAASHAATHTHLGHVVSPPLAYAPEILSQFTPPPTIAATLTWRDWVQVAHLAITVLLFISVLVRMAEGFGFGRIRKLIKGGDAGVNKRVEKVILGTESVTSLTSALTLYRSLSPETTSPIIKALFLYTIASTSSPPPGCMKYLIKMRANSIWNNALAVVTTKKECVVLSNPIEKVFSALPSIRANLQNGEELVDSIAAYIIKQKLGRVLGKMFVREVTGSSISQEKEKEKEAVEVETEMSDKDIKAIIEAAKDLGGEVSLLAKNVERVRASSGVVSSVIGWSASPMTPQSLIRDDGDDDDDESDSSSSSESPPHSLLSEDSALDEEEGDEDTEGVDMPFTVLRALVLYRSLFSSSSSSMSSTSSSMLTPTISIEPPTPTIPSPLLSHLHTRTPITTTIPKNITTKTTTTTVGNGARKRMYALRKLLGSRVFEKDEVEDARDRVVDMLVEAERRSARTSPARV